VKRHPADVSALVQQRHRWRIHQELLQAGTLRAERRAISRFVTIETDFATSVNSDANVGGHAPTPANGQMIRAEKSSALANVHG
jgi:hypothetical protein